MAWYSISLFAFLLVASYASATTLQELCKGSPDANSCVEEFKPFLSEAFVLKSEGWWRDVAAMDNAAMMTVKEHIDQQRQKLKGKDAAVLDTCVQNVLDSGKLVQDGLFDDAATELGKCSQSLEGEQGEVVQDVKSLVNKFSHQLKTVNYVFTKAKERHN